MRVMTFNVRQLEPDDSALPWLQRRDLLVSTILRADPDLIGSQELFTAQADYLSSRASQYEWFGGGRYGDDRDKHNGIWFRRGTLRLRQHGDLWLSETPEKAGSCSWGIPRPRMITWGEFETSGGLRFLHFNTHFPYRTEDAQARVESAKLLLRELAKLPAAMPVILTADANEEAGGEIYQMLTEYFRDAWVAAAQRGGNERTLLYAEKRIDWILLRAAWRVERADTIPGAASDHYPVIADFIIS